MQDILKEIHKTRQKLELGPTIPLSQKPFAQAMYHFSMFIISYYSRVKEQLKLDYDSFMIVQTVVSHTLYYLKKKEYEALGYEELEERIVDILDDDSFEGKNYKLTISSICLVAKLPKETVRRKVNALVKKNLLKISKENGILPGHQYKKVFQEFVPKTTLEISKLIKLWDKTGVLKNIMKL